MARLMRLEPPPATPACIKEDPYVFDTEWAYGYALGVCANCQVRAWCLRTVDPASTYYDGVVGGHAWKDGRISYKHSNPDTDPVVMAYLGTKRRGSREKNRAVNLGRVQDFMVGRIRNPNALTFAELLEATVRMQNQGVPLAVAQKATKLPDHTIQDIYDNPDKYQTT